jgi:hypothetical protein
MIIKIYNIIMSENLKPLSIKQLIDKLNLIMKGLCQKMTIYILPVGEDEGNVSALTPVFNVSCPSLKLNKSELKKIINNRGIDLSFVSQITYINEN